MERDGANQLVARRAIPAWRRLLGHFADPLVYLLLAATAIALAAWWAEGREGIPYDVIVIAFVILANAALGFIQERRSEDAVAALQRMAAPTAGVVRDGRIDRIPALDLVVGDVLVLGAGDAITADARLTESALSVAEAALTGESAPVDKGVAPLDGPAGIGDRSCMVFAGTAVTRGTGRAIVTSTGMHTETGRIAQLLGETASDPTPLQREIAQLSKVLGIGVLAIAAVVIGTVFLTEDISTLAGAVQVLLLGVALAVAAVPEGLPAILSVYSPSGCSAWPGATRSSRTFLRSRRSARRPVICSDKTGTLTQNRMTITRVVTASGETDLDWGARQASLGRARRRGDGRDDGRRVWRTTPWWAGTMTTRRSAAIPRRPPSSRRSGSWGWRSRGASASRSSALSPSARSASECPWSRRMGAAASTSRAEGGAGRAAPRVHGGARGGRGPAARRRRPRPVLAEVERMSALGMRTLAVAHRRGADESEAEAESLERDLVLAGMVGIVDPPREEARTAVAAAQRAGIRVIMITGDHPLTASAIAVSLGIVEEDPESLPASNLPR